MGLFCAHPYIEKLLGLTTDKLEYYQQNPNAPFPGLVRISLGMYNTCQEVDILIDSLIRIAKNKNAYKEKYERSI